MKPVIVMKQADTLVPQEYLQKVLALGPACIGIAAASVDDKGPVILLDHMPDLKEIGDQDTVLKELNNIQEALKANHLLLWFGPSAGVVNVAADGGYETPDMQPFSILRDGNDRTQLVACLNGDYSAFAQEKSEHPAEFFACQEDLIPRLMQVYEAQGEKISKVMDHVRSNALLIRDLKKISAGDTGLLTLFASDGDMLTLQKKDGMIFDTEWGWNTDNIEGVLEKKEEPKPVAGTRFSKLFLGRKNVQAKAAEPENKPVVEIPKADPVITEPKTDTAIPETLPKGITRDENGVLWAKCPEMNWSKNQKKDWYLKNAGYVPPQNLKNCPRVEVKIDKKDLKQLDRVIAASQTATEQVKAVAAEPKPKDTETKHIPATAGIAPAAEKEGFKTDPIILSYVDKNGNKLIPFETFARNAADRPSFSEQSNIHLDEVKHWPPELILHVVQTRPNLATALIMGLVADKYKAELEGKTTYVEPKIEEKKAVNSSGTVAPPSKFAAAMEARKRARM